MILAIEKKAPLLLIVKQVSPFKTPVFLLFLINAEFSSVLLSS